MEIGLHGLGMVQGIACCVHWGAIWQVADGIGEESTGQWRSWSVWIWSNGLRVVDGVAGPVHWRAIWQVASSATKDRLKRNPSEASPAPNIFKVNLRMSKHAKEWI